MAWSYQGKLMKAGRVWTDLEGRKYPPQWMSRSTDEEKIALGWVWNDEPQPVDRRFYTGRDENGDPVARNLDDINAVDDNGDPVLDEDGNQFVVKGVKTLAIEQTKLVASGLLAPTDWKVVKAAEVADYTVDAETLAYRAAVRQASNDIETAILAAVDMDAFIALHDVERDADGTPIDPTEVPVVNQWPAKI